MIIFNTSTELIGQAKAIYPIYPKRSLCFTDSKALVLNQQAPAAFKLSVCGPPLPGGRLSQSQPEWMDPSPQVLGIRHVTAKLSPTSSHILYVQVILLVHLQLAREPHSVAQLAY